MDWDKLRIFHNVAEIRNLTHAGSALNLSQSAVSRQISNLEKDLKLPLFTRHARGLALTSEGEILFKTTRSIFSQISATASQLAESYDQLGGTLKISATVALGSVWLAPRLPDFCKD
jgi:DNA-binding transcriptional LysR family regulator